MTIQELMFLEMAEVKETSLKAIPVTSSDFFPFQWNLHNTKIGQK